MGAEESFDRSAHLWPASGEQYFRQHRLQPARQLGPSCVATALHILTGGKVQNFRSVINTQDPVSWSDALRSYGMKLAYCPADVRQLQYYLPELQRLDDLFLLSYYTPARAPDILRSPAPSGWVCGSHVVVLHRDRIFDPMDGTTSSASFFPGASRYTKRIFRVLPVQHPRGL